ncbi:MAG: hypothetical protein HYT97_07090 [Elusimicrobia bacterium]|nr:hypothetical protein [Elusimicrobiota bacterium]
MFKFNQTSPRKCWLIGHRGAMGHAPENTLASFICGQKLGADMLECDIHLSKDRKCVVMHDESVERTTNGHGQIRNLTASNIKRLDAGSWYSKKNVGERALLLEELLDWIKEQKSCLGRPLGLAIEIKNEPIRYLDIEKVAIEIVKKKKMESRTIFISFDHGVVKRAKSLEPNIPTGILYREPLADTFKRAKELKVDAIFPRRHLITKTLVQNAHKHKLFVATWTVNEVKEMKKIFGIGIDAIATNFPDRLNRVLSNAVKR